MFELAIATLPLGLTDFSGAKLFWLGVLGNLVIIFLGTRLVIHTMKGDWGYAISFFVGGLFAAWFVWENDSAVAFMRSLTGMIFGG